MDLFSQPPPFENITFKNGKALCLTHQQDLNSVYLNRGLFGSSSNIAACPKCSKPESANAHFLAAFKAYSANQCCVVSPNNSEKQAPTVKNPSLDFGNDVVEHVLWDMNSDGYELKSLVYMKDQKVLAACSKNGPVCFWSMGDSVELIEPKLNLEKKINFAKYCIISKDKKYLAIGTDRGVHVYNITKKGSSIQLLGVIDEEKVVSDLDFLEIEGKIVTVYNESIAKIWNLYTLKMEEVIDLHKYDIKGKIHTVMYLETSGKLAIEHEKGLSLIRDLLDQESADVQHHFVENKTNFGCKYLLNSGRFILNNGSFIEVLGEENFELMRRYDLPQSRPLIDNLPRKFIAYGNEHFFISNGQFSQFNSFQDGQLFRHSPTNFIRGKSEVELMEDQYRIAVAHPQKGAVTILRLNANVNIERGEGLSLLPAVFSAEQRLVATGGGSLFSGSSSGVDLFSGDSAPSSINPSSRENKTGLFSGNSSKKSIKSTSKPASKPAKKGKKIQKVQIRRSNATKKKEKSSLSSSVKNEKTIKIEFSKKHNKDMIEAVRIRGKKKTKEEKVWVVLPSADDNDDEKKRGRSLKKKKNEEVKAGKIKRKTDISKDKGSRSRSKSKSVTRRK